LVFANYGSPDYQVQERTRRLFRPPAVQAPFQTD